MVGVCEVSELLLLGVPLLPLLPGVVPLLLLLGALPLLLLLLGELLLLLPEDCEPVLRVVLVAVVLEPVL